MTNAVWPTTLPQNPFGNDDPVYTAAENILRTQMQRGPSKARPLFTSVPEMLQVKLQLNPTQRADLRTFLATTLGYTLPFTWIDFRTGLPATYRYGGTALPPEQYLGTQSDGGTWWLIQMDLELLP